MVRKEIYEILRYYYEFKEAVERNMPKLTIIKSRVKKDVTIDENVKALVRIIGDFSRTLNNEFIRDVLHIYFFRRKTENYVLRKLPTSHSSFIRAKECIAQRVYELAISAGIVRYDEILQQQINR